MVDPTAIRARYEALSPHLDERGRRVFAASEARTAGYGGIAAVSRATGIAASTIGRGLDELADTAAEWTTSRVRRPGGGRKPLVLTDASLLEDLLSLVSPGERGDPMSALRWTCKSLRRLAAELSERGHRDQPYNGGRVAEAMPISACRPIARPARATIIRTATRSSNTSTAA